MNSKQRRKDNRAWKYRIDMGIRKFNDYVDMWCWLSEKHGKKVSSCGWRDRLDEVDELNDQYRLVWEFIKERDAIEFSLRWM
jgi:hypothetical protein